MAKKTHSEPAAQRQLPKHVGGCFAPPLSEQKLESYRKLIESQEPGPVKDACYTLLKCVEVWWELPEPEGGKRWAHPSGTGTIVSLQKDHAESLWESIPWDHELDSIQTLLDKIEPSTKTSLRNAAFHLLWFVRELNNDREPLTADKLGS